MSREVDELLRLQNAGDASEQLRSLFGFVYLDSEAESEKWLRALRHFHACLVFLYAEEEAANKLQKYATRRTLISELKEVVCWSDFDDSTRAAIAKIARSGS